MTFILTFLRSLRVNVLCSFEENSRTNDRRSKGGFKFIIKINFRVEMTIFTQFDEVQYNKQCNMNKFRRIILNIQIHSFNTDSMSR